MIKIKIKTDIQCIDNNNFVNDSRPAEVITNEDEAFATTIMFYSEGAATEVNHNT